MAQDRPNVLFIMDDQHNARCMGCAGEPVLRTPAIDSLAETGVRFNQAFAQNPICMPSRISFLSGQYVHTHGVYGNYWGALPDETPSLAKTLADAGYQTAAIGKLHISVGWGTDGFQEKVLCDYADVVDDPLDNDYYRYLVEHGLANEYDLGTASSRFAYSAFVSNIPAEHCVENWNGDQAVQWLKRRDKTKPFFLWMTFQRPHNPFAPPPEYADLYRPEDLVLPPAGDRLETKPEHHRLHLGSRLDMIRDERDLRQVLAYYYALITLIDENVGKVLRALKEEGIRDDTLIVFSADHGDFAGEHGVMDKNVGIYESIQRIPMVMNYPRRFASGLVREDLVESVDVAPTIIETLGIPVPETMEGQSLLGSALADGPEVDRDAVFCEWEHVRSVRTRRWRLNHYVVTGEGELYDRDNDPGETTNLYDDPAYRDVRFELTRKLMDFISQSKGVAFRGSSDHHRPVTEAVRVWEKPWWREGGKGNVTPLWLNDDPSSP